MQARELLERLVKRDLYSVMFEMKSRNKEDLVRKYEEINQWITANNHSKKLGVHVIYHTLK